MEEKVLDLSDYAIQIQRVMRGKRGRRRWEKKYARWVRISQDYADVRLLAKRKKAANDLFSQKAYAEAADSFRGVIQDGRQQLGRLAEGGGDASDDGEQQDCLRDDGERQDYILTYLLAYLLTYYTCVRYLLTYIFTYLLT